MPCRTNSRHPNNLKEFRKRKRLTMDQMRRLAGLSCAGDYYRWESGQMLPSLENVLKLSYILECPAEVLFFKHYDRLRRQIKELQERIKRAHSPPEY